MAVAVQEALERKRILRRSQVETLTGLSRSTIYARIQQGTFPPPIQLGSRAVGWTVADIDHWLEARIAATRRESKLSAKEV
ncbi:helix-turn-helix transcriptional regulator [Paraburkholderia sp. BR10936]|uniref:helix-turn-helix transcriptional regulator n=1 Tax=Paraburkholderia sp. BR10936 TaxID=3236993 RepID=UPI0034D26256